MYSSSDQLLASTSSRCTSSRLVANRVAAAPRPGAARARAQEHFVSSAATKAASGGAGEFHKLASLPSPVRQATPPLCQPPLSDDRLSTREPSETASDASEPHLSGLLIFDWDDTLFPTSGVVHAQGLLSSAGVLRAHGASLRRHAEVVEETLRAAAALSHVCIVTMAARGWVEESARICLPGFDAPKLFAELAIPVYYARDMLGDVDITTADLEVQKTMKMAAMAQALNDAYAKVPPSSQTLNVLSVGDSIIERLALRELLCMWQTDGLLMFRPNVKTLKLLEQPPLLTLTRELQGLLPCLAGLHSHEGDLDLEPAHPCEFKTGHLKQFSSDVVSTVYLGP